MLKAASSQLDLVGLHLLRSNVFIGLPGGVSFFRSLSVEDDDWGRAFIVVSMFGGETWPLEDPISYVVDEMELLFRETAVQGLSWVLFDLS